jgi:hypothetical protein
MDFFPLEIEGNRRVIIFNPVVKNYYSNSLLILIEIPSSRHGHKKKDLLIDYLAPLQIP